MENKVLFKGIFPALVSPFDENGDILVEETKRLVKWEMSWGVNGFYICGSTGEGLVMKSEARKKLLEVVLEATEGKVPVIDHIGAIDLRTTIELAKHAEKAGAAAISSIPPIYFRYDEDEIVNYYKAITDACSLPLVMYGIGNTGIQLSFNTVKRVMELPHAIGLKWTYPDYFTLGKIKDIDGGNINVINGPDEMLVCGLAIGADAGIGTTYNLMPGLFVELYREFNAGNVTRAREIQHAINKVIDVLLKNNALPATKAAIRGLLGFNVGECTPPLKQYSHQEFDKLMNDLSGIIDFKTQKIL